MAPYTDSHRLTGTTTAGDAHLAACAHSTSPKDASGNYVFEPAWRSLYGLPAQ